MFGSLLLILLDYCCYTYFVVLDALVNPFKFALLLLRLALLLSIFLLMFILLWLLSNGNRYGSFLVSEPVPMRLLVFYMV